MVKLSDPLAQIIIVGLICFCCPGMFNALQGTGTYGLSAKDSDVGNHASIALGCLFAFSSLFAGALFNILGHRILLILGGLSYVLYVGSFLAYHYIHSLAFVVVTSCVLGIGAGWLWCAQGAVMMGYPAEHEKGKYFAIFWAIFNCGGVLGNIIPISIQWNDDTISGASTTTYVAFMIVMTIGTMVSIFLLPISKVFRKDGSSVVRIRYSSPISEIKSVFALFRDWRMLTLVPMFFTSNWFYTYQFSVNSLNFSTRTRSMNSMFYWMAQIFSSICYGAFLDKRSWNRKTRARYGLILLALLLAGTWTGAIFFQSTFGPQSYIIEDGITVKNPDDYLKIDLVRNTSEYLGPFFLYFAYGVTDAMYQGYSYWLMGALTNDTNQAARFAGFYKFVQNLGGVLAPVVQTSILGNAPSAGANAQNAIHKGMGELIICIALVFLGIVGAIPVAFRAVQNHTIDEDDDLVSEKEEFVLEPVRN
ncbi:hypothetical protein BG011_001351 [Mortierella polycephala]|uniref:MFS general substrate transporter n=1 Tax=Mortierella polycephala TaxID=41804 RepID=A0A9P6Q7B6_9FUNG|nr:hypothetical protein BG011_001351 [Mortierella polycephala]